MIGKSILRDKYLYLMLVPVALYYALFKYFPMQGEIIAFKNYRFVDGIWGSDWAGLKHYRRLFASREFYTVLKNTLLLNLYLILFSFPVPIVLSLLLNELKAVWFKRTVQNLLYIPHFISWVVLGGIVIAVLSPSTGVVNLLLSEVFGVEPVYFMISPAWWPVAFVLSAIWQSAGWGTILYLAAMAGIDEHLYEAARMDGAGRFRCMWHVTLPGIRPTIAILLVLSTGNAMDIGFEHVYALQNDAVLGVADVISTYVWRTGLQGMQYSYTTALGLFQSLIGLVLVLLVNRLIRMSGERGLW